MEILQELLPFGKWVIIVELAATSVFLGFFMFMFYKISKNMFK